MTLGHTWPWLQTPVCLLTLYKWVTPQCLWLYPDEDSLSVETLDITFLHLSSLSVELSFIFKSYTPGFNSPMTCSLFNPLFPHVSLWVTVNCIAVHICGLVFIWRVLLYYWVKLLSLLISAVLRLTHLTSYTDALQAVSLWTWLSAPFTAHCYISRLLMSPLLL